MIDPRIEDLLNQEIDGEATDEQRTALQDELPAFPEAQSYRDDLQKLQKVLLAAKEVEAPSALRDEILFRVDQARDNTRTASLATAQFAEAGAGESPGFWQSLLGGLRSGFRDVSGLRRREIFTFAAGATFGIVLLFVSSNRMTSIPDGAFPGAMVPLSTIADATLVDSAALQGDNVQGHIEIARNAGYLFASIQVQSPQPVTIELQFDSQVLAIRGITQNIGDAPLQAALEAGRVEIQHQGDNTYHLTMEDRGNSNRASEVRIRLNTAGQIIDKTFRTTK